MMVAEKSKLDVEKMKADALRRELGARGLDTTGLKAVLQKRLKQALEEENAAPEGAPEAEKEVKEAPDEEEKVDVKDSRKEEEKKETVEETPEESKPEEKKEEEEEPAKAEDEGQTDEFEDQRRRRAERFGVPYEPRKNVVVDEKKKKRAERFGVQEEAQEEKPAAPAVSPEEAEKRRLRALKFGLGEKSAKDSLQDEGMLKNPSRLANRKPYLGDNDRKKKARLAN